MRAACRRNSTKRLLALVSLVAILATLISAPWWWTWLLWRPSSTSFASSGPGQSLVVVPFVLAIVQP